MIEKKKPLNNLSGYYIIEGQLIHYYSKNFEYQTTKIRI